MTKPEDRDIRDSLDTRMLAYAISSEGVEGCQGSRASFPTRILQEGRLAYVLAGPVNTASHRNCEEEEKHSTGRECQAHGRFGEASVIMQSF